MFIQKNRFVINFSDGKKLIKLAKSKKLYVGNAPDTFLGGGLQKSIEILDKKVIGNIKFGNAIFAYPGVQSYHPNPEPWFSKKWWTSNRYGSLLFNCIS